MRVNNKSSEAGNSDGRMILLGESQEALAGRISQGDVYHVDLVAVYPRGVGRCGGRRIDSCSGGSRRGAGGDCLVGRAHDVVVDGVAVLALIELLAHHVLEVAAAEVEDLPEGLAEVAVQGRVDYGIEEAVAVAQPEEHAGEEGGYDVRVAQDYADDGEDEEGQPADGERAHYYAEGRRRFALFGQLEAQPFLLVGRVHLAARAVGVAALTRRARRPGGDVRGWRRRRRGCDQDRLLLRAGRLQHRALGLVALARTARETLHRVHAAL